MLQEMLCPLFSLENYIYFVHEKYRRFISVFWESDSFFVEPLVLKLGYTCRAVWCL